MAAGAGGVTPSCRILHGDCRDVMRTLAADSVDALVTDPPYGLSREPDMAEVLRHWLAGDDYEHGSVGFMGRAWDSFVPGPAVWREALHVLKPGGFCVAFFGTRTYDIGVTAMRLAGFEVREMFAWLHGQGMNKVGYLREDDGEIHIRQGWGGSVKPALEPIVLARKSLSEKTLAANVLRWGTGALNVDGCRVATETPRPGRSNAASASGLTGTGGAVTFGAYAVRGSIAVEDTTLGRWPPNVMHDGSQAVLDLFPQSDSRGGSTKRAADIGFHAGGRGAETANYGADSGSAARFYPAFPPEDAPPFAYHPKANKRDRAGSSHPTVKPQGLMRHLCRLVTPPGGVVLDPFAGSGSTLQAARDEGFDAIGIEREAEYVTDCRRRMGMAPPIGIAAE